jgi:anthranilate 3-monooxygenase (FAD)/4-hydroxyphenylacetate 3-monooxygenase
MGIRTGQQYLEGLRKGRREVWLRGQRVEDVTTHPAFARPLAHTARLFDLQHDPQHQDALTFIAENGERVSVAHLPCRTQDDLRRREQAYRLVAEQTLGMMGRSPDFLGSVVYGFGEAAELLEPLGQRFADNLRAYAKKVRDEDLFLTHAIITPQTDRSRNSGQQADEFLHLGIVRETDEGLIVRGARMLATMGPISDEVLIYSMAHQKQEDRNYVFIFALPLDTPGIRQICREPYDDGDRLLGNHPLAANFEDSDTLIIFDDVLVPWERVFAYDNVDVINRFAQSNSGRNHSSHQAAVRGLVKLEFVIGLIMEIVKANGAEKFLHVQQMVGECIHYMELMKSCLSRAIAEAEVGFQGLLRPPMLAVNTGRMLTARFYPRIVEILQTVGAGGMQMMPSIEDLSSPIASDIAKYYQGAGGVDAEQRIRLFKMAWDMCGDAFGQRQVQYERYHLGDPVRNLANLFLNYDRSRCQRMVAKAFEVGANDVLQSPGTDLRMVA